MPRIFAIGDLHLSLSVENKSMDVFGPGWANHVDRLREGWQDTVGEDDLVLIPGDISWGLRLEEAAADLDFNAAMEQAFAAAKYLYQAYLEAKAAQGYGGSGGKKEERLTEAQVKNSLAQAVAAARGQIKTNPNGAGFYAKGDHETASRTTNSDLPKYVKKRAQMNGDYTASQLKQFRQMNLK